MRKLGIILGFVVLSVVVLIGGAVAWYKISYPTYTYRYRMTVEVVTDGALRSGSSVIEVQLIKQPPIITNSPPVFPKVRGEAVFVDLGAGRNVIALLAAGPNGNNVDYPSSVVAQHFRLSGVKNEDLARFPKLQGRWELPEDQIPTLVTFADTNDPKSARVVGPGEFTEVLGPGVRLERVWIEMTDTPVTMSIERRLPWLKTHKGYLGGSFDATWTRPARNLTGAEFVQGL